MGNYTSLVGAVIINFVLQINDGTKITVCCQEVQNIHCEKEIGTTEFAKLVDENVNDAL